LSQSLKEVLLEFDDLIRDLEAAEEEAEASG
jgi:hypothetical protein